MKTLTLEVKVSGYEKKYAWTVSCMSAPVGRVLHLGYANTEADALDKAAQLISSLSPDELEHRVVDMAAPVTPAPSDNIDELQQRLTDELRRNIQLMDAWAQSDRAVAKLKADLLKSLLHDFTPKAHEPSVK